MADEFAALELEQNWGPSSSQADEILAKASAPGMYSQTVSTDPVVFVERLAADIIEYRFENLPHDDSVRIVLEILPKALELYLKKTKDYGGLSGGLGPKAPF